MNVNLLGTWTAQGLDFTHADRWYFTVLIHDTFRGMHSWSKTWERVKDLKQEKMDCIKRARFKHARFHSAVTPGLIPLTSMGTGPIYSMVNNQNEACGSSPTEPFILSTAGSLGSIRAIPHLWPGTCCRDLLDQTTVCSEKPSVPQQGSLIGQANPAFTLSSSLTEVSQDK